MSALPIVLIVVGVLIVVVLIGGFVAVRRRERERAPEYLQHLAAADEALEAGQGCRQGLGPRRDGGGRHSRAPGASGQASRPSELHLVLVDDQPGVDEDRAHFVARGGGDEVRVVLSRGEAGWAAESVD